MEWLDLLWIVVVLLIGGGLAGAILPALPGRKSGTPTPHTHKEPDCQHVGV